MEPVYETANIFNTITMKQYFKLFTITAKQCWSTPPWLVKKRGGGGGGVCSTLAFLIAYFAIAFYGYFIITMPLLFLVASLAWAYFLSVLIIKFPALYVAVLLNTPKVRNRTLRTVRGLYYNF